MSQITDHLQINLWTALITSLVMKAGHSCTGLRCKQKASLLPLLVFLKLHPHVTLLFNSTFCSLPHSTSSQETREMARQPISCQMSSISQVPLTPFELYTVRSSFDSLTLSLSWCSITTMLLYNTKTFHLLVKVSAEYTQH